MAVLDDIKGGFVVPDRDTALRLKARFSTLFGGIRRVLVSVAKGQELGERSREAWRNRSRRLFRSGTRGGRRIMAPGDQFLYEPTCCSAIMLSSHKSSIWSLRCPNPTGASSPPMVWVAKSRHQLSKGRVKGHPMVFRQRNSQRFDHGNFKGARFQACHRGVNCIPTHLPPRSSALNGSEILVKCIAG